MTEPKVIDWSATVAYTALCVSVISPIISSIVITWMNHRHEIKMHNLRFYTIHRADVIEGYLRSAGACIKECNSQNSTEYGKFYGDIFLYAPTPLCEKIRELDALLNKYDDINSCSNMLADIALEFSKLQVRTKE